MKSLKILFIEKDLVVLEDLKKALNKIKFFMKLRGYSFSPYSNMGVDFFLNRSLDDQIKISENIKTYLDILERSPCLFNPSSFGKKLNKKEEHEIFSIFSQKFSIIMNSDVIELFEKGDIIEVYTQDHTQLYGNFNFLSQCNYDHLTTKSAPWHEIYEREPYILELIKEKLDELFNDPSKYKHLDLTEGSIPPHPVRELLLPRCKRRYLLQVKHLIKIPQSGGSHDSFIIVISNAKKIKNN